MAKYSATFIKERDTKNTVRYAEHEVPEGGDAE